MRRLSALLLGTVLVSGGCAALETFALADEPPTLQGAPIQTDSSVYHVRRTQSFYEINIGVTYTNPTAGPVYIPTCRTVNPPSLQKWVGGEWVHAFSPVVLQCLGAPVVIASGETFRYHFKVEAAHTANTFPRFDVAEIPGRYRLVWNILGTWEPDGPEPGLGKELPLEQRVSGAFRIEM